MRVFDFNRAIVRQPAESVIDGLRAGDHAGPSYAGILSEHSAYVSALEQAGLAVTVLPALPRFPDSIFVEDPALVFTEGAILLRPGAPSRSAEAEALAADLHPCFAEVLRLPAGHVDGGDVLVTPGCVYIGLSDRTDRAGAEALIGLLARWDRKAAVATTPPGTLHLKTASSLIDEETVLMTPELAAANPFPGLRVLTVPAGEEGGANVLRLNDRVLIGACFPGTLDLLSRHGLDLVPLAVSEIGKIDAGLTCMSLRWFAA